MKRDVWSERADRSVVVALMEVVMVVVGLERAAKSLITKWMYCVG